MTRKGEFPPLLARVTCLQQVINCIAYVAGVERDGGRKGGMRERSEGFPFSLSRFSPPSFPPFLCACHAGYQLQWMLLEMSFPLLSRLRAVVLLLKNLWGSGTASSVLCGRLYERPDASTILALLAALLLEYSNIPLPHRFSNKSSSWNKNETARSLFAIRHQTNQRFCIKIFLFNYVYLHVTGTARKVVLEHIIIFLERMQTKVTLKLPKVCKHICLVIQWEQRLYETVFVFIVIWARADQP